jgi:hypothetical protein
LSPRYWCRCFVRPPLRRRRRRPPMLIKPEKGRTTMIELRFDD